MGIFDEITDWVHDLFDPSDAKSLADVGIDPAEGGVDDALAAESGADPAATSEAAFPNPSGSPVMDQVNASMAEATEAYEDGMEIAGEAPQMESAGEQAQGIIDGVMSASPEQLADMEGTLGALNASDEISADVAESQQDLLDSEATHQAIMDANSAEIEAKSVNAGAEEAIDDAEEAL